LRARSGQSDQQLDRTESAGIGHQLAIQPGNRHPVHLLVVDDFPGSAIAFVRRRLGAADRRVALRPIGSREPVYLTLPQRKYSPYRSSRRALHRGDRVSRSGAGRRVAGKRDFAIEPPGRKASFAGWRLWRAVVLLSLLRPGFLSASHGASLAESTADAQA